MASLAGAPVNVSLIKIHIGRITEHADDVPRQMILDLAVSGDRLGYPGRRVPIPVVPPTMADQDASDRLDRADQIHASRDHQLIELAHAG